MLVFAEAYIQTIKHGMDGGIHYAMDIVFDYYQTM
jgi:hypothetical protein